MFVITFLLLNESVSLISLLFDKGDEYASIGKA